MAKKEDAQQAPETDEERAARAAKEKAADDAVAAFIAADADYRTEEEAFLRGDMIVTLVVDAIHGGKHPEECRAAWAGEVERLQRKIEDRNSKLKEAQLALRDIVRIGEFEERGPDAKPLVVTKGPFKVNSVTGRTLDIPTLLHLAERNEIRDKLLALSTNKDGAEVPVLHQVWELNFDYMMTWLKSHKYEGIINACYKEVDKTPQVAGPKPLAFLGTEMK